MIVQLIAPLARLLPRRDPPRVAQPWFNPDSNWHVSSFELASGLQVIEHAVPPAGFGEARRFGPSAGA